MSFDSFPGTLLRFVPGEGRLPDWMPQLRETVATCGTCIRCAPGVEFPFFAASKCCTHVPFLPNYSVGETLQAGGQAADVVRARLRTLSAWPLGLRPTPQEETLERRRGPEGFGVDDRVVCPFLIEGQCSIWSSRPAVCASYFCETSYGDNGRSLWRRVRAYFAFVETTLAGEALAQMGFLEDEIALSWRWLPRKEGVPGAFSPADQRSAWLEFDADRASFFLRAAAIVAGLSATHVQDLLGEDGRRLWKDVEGVGRATVHLAEQAKRT